jgi:hypothetical protein
MAKPGPAAGFDSIVHPQKRALLHAYSETRRLKLSYEAAGVSRQLHYYWLKTDPAYQAAFADARDQAADVLEDEAVKRAMGTTEGASDTLLIFLLKGAKPDVYKEIRKEEHHVTLTVQLEHRLTRALTQIEATRNGHPGAITPHP